MTHVRVRGFKIYRDRHGRWRCYHRKTGIAVDLKENPLGSAEFFARCTEIDEEQKARAAQPEKPGTLGGLIRTYRETDHWREQLSPRTRIDYDRCADYLKPIEDTPVHLISTPLIAGIHNKAAEKLGWRRANYVRTFLSEVFKRCKPLGLIDENFAKDVLPKRRPKSAPRKNRPWTAKELQTVQTHASPQMRVAIALMANTGMDPSDAVRLKRSEISGNVIRGLRGKTGEPIAVPIGTALRDALAAAPDHDAITVLANTKGKPWTYNGIATTWHRFKKHLEEKGLVEPGLTLKGLRHTVATTLREAGWDTRKIADLLGQKTESMALHYSDTANLESVNRKTVKVLDRENKKRAKSV